MTEKSTIKDQTVSESSSIKDLGRRASNVSLYVGRLNKDLYGIDFPELIQTVSRLAFILAEMYGKGGAKDDNAE